MQESTKNVVLQNALTFGLVIVLPALIIGWDVYSLLHP